MAEINNLNASKKLLPFIIGGVVILVFLLGVVFTLTQGGSGSNFIPNLPNIPEAQPQIFVNQNSNQFGALIVTSKMDKIKVTIDQKEVSDPDFFAYSNTPPFKVSRIPVGTHVLRAEKEGFLTSTISVEIKKGQVTTTDITLSLNPDLGNLKKAEVKMPIVTQEYNIEYLNYIGIVQVNVTQAPYETNKQKAIEWFKEQGVDNPEAQGVQFNDLTKTYVH